MSNQSYIFKRIQMGPGIGGGGGTAKGLAFAEGGGVGARVERLVQETVEEIHVGGNDLGGGDGVVRARWWGWWGRGFMLQVDAGRMGDVW